MPRRPPKNRSRPGPFLTTREAAERLGVSINALKAWIRQERLPALRTPGGHHRIAEADIAEFQARLAENSHAPVSTRPRILLVDDDAPLLATLRESLEQVLPEAVVSTASDGYDALVHVGAARPDVLVLDIRMPRLDGLEVCRRLKARKETAGIRILAMTGFPDGQIRDAVLACGADDFLEKPFALEKFRSRVVALLARGLARGAGRSPAGG